MSKEILFTYAQGNMLIRLLIAHLAADFIFQTRQMVLHKRWLSWAMLWHILVVYMCTAVISGWWLISIIIAVLHYLTDGLKYSLQQKRRCSELFMFVADQVVHVSILLFTWACYYGLLSPLAQALAFPFTDYRLSLLLLGYLIVIFPAGYITGFVTRSWAPVAPAATPNGGKYIGIFERIIILTFVLLKQYDAIGFLITGKSIIRFAAREEHIRSEYVLVGTMLSYALSILSGILIIYLS